MINELLTRLDRSLIRAEADVYEKVGNFGLGLLRIAYGKTVTVDLRYDTNSRSGKLDFKLEKYSIVIRVIALAVFIFARPITIPLAIAGVIATKCSATHNRVFDIYRNPPAAAPVVDSGGLWQHLKIWTKIIYSRIPCLPAEAPVRDADGLYYYHRYPEMRYSKETAIQIGGKWLRANRVGQDVTRRVFVASEAPSAKDKKTLTQDNRAEYWQAFYQHDATIIDVTTAEDHKDSRAHIYYPETVGQTVEYGNMSVTLQSMGDYSPASQIKVYTYQVVDASGFAKIITRYHCMEWTDRNKVGLNTFISLIQIADTVASSEGLLWTHCSAGMGRTGTLITACILKEKIKSGEITKENLHDSLAQLLLTLRKQRGDALLQCQLQLDFVLMYATALLECEQVANSLASAAVSAASPAVVAVTPAVIQPAPVCTIPQDIAEAITALPDISGDLQRTFKAKWIERPLLTQKDCSSHLRPEVSCVKETAIQVDGQYLHANHVNLRPVCYHVISQSPGNTEFARFWEAVCTYHLSQSNENLRVIVDLTPNEDYNAGAAHRYYPTGKNQTIQHDHMKVTLYLADGPIYTYLVKNEKTSQQVFITRYHYEGLVDYNNLPALIEPVDMLCGLLGSLMNQLWIHCYKGVGRSAVLFTAFVLKKRMEIYGGAFTKDNLAEKLIELIIELREQTSLTFIERSEHLQFLYQYGTYLLESRAAAALGSQPAAADPSGSKEEQKA